MPELPDIEAYVAACKRLIRGQLIQSINIHSPFLLRSYQEEIAQCVGLPVVQVSRIGKQIVWQVGDELFLVFHLMISGRFHWKPQVARLSKWELACIQFERGSLILAERATKKRASLHLVRGSAALNLFRQGGLEVLDASLPDFESVLARQNSTLKRALTDPRRFSGIGNAYSDEILVEAGLSPFLRTQQLDDKQCQRLLAACQNVLQSWRNRLVREAETVFPENVTPFREEMLVHGRFGKPCGKCGCRVERVIYNEREFNYCPQCQTGGKILADRSLSRLLKDEWPTRIDDEE